MLEIFKFVCTVVKEETKKVCTEIIDEMLYHKPCDLSGGVGVPYTGGPRKQIRVIGRIVTRY